MYLLATFPVAVSIVLVLMFRFINKPYNPPIFGVYRRRNKYFWCKFVFMYFLLRFKQLFVHLKRMMAVELGYSYDGTVHIHEDDVRLEQKYSLGNFPLAVDAVYFNGSSKDGTSIICGIARRPQNVCDAFLYLKLAGKYLLLTPTLPDTYMKKEQDDDEYAVAGMSAFNFIPMRTWNLAYHGEMKSEHDSEKKVKVDMSLVWSAAWPVFNYDIHMSPRSMAKDLARERWSADYFKLLKTFHQTHYEQMGYLAGTVTVDGITHAVNMPCVRDRSFGTTREWRNFHRYVLHFMYLDNGDCIAVGAVSQPVILSHLTIGYLCRKSDQSVMPVKKCDFELWQHGENQTLPRDYGFSFRAGGEQYDVQVKVRDEASFYIGKLREAKFYERWFSVTVNGVSGWGCSEWQYNNVAMAK